MVDHKEIQGKIRELLGVQGGFSHDSMTSHAFELALEMIRLLSEESKRYQWILNEPEASRHLLRLLMDEGPDKKESFSNMIDRIRKSQENHAST